LKDSSLIAQNHLAQYARTGLRTLLFCLATGVLLHNLYLLRVNRTLRQSASFTPPEIQEGRTLGDLSGVNMNGELDLLALPTEDTKLIIITMSPGCPACRSNQSGWAKLASGLKTSDHWRIAWVSRDSVDLTKRYFREVSLPPSKVIADPLHGTYLQLGLQTVPHMIVVGRGGVVEKVWRGRLTAAQWIEVADYFRVPALASQ